MITRSMARLVAPAFCILSALVLGLAGPTGCSDDDGTVAGDPDTALDVSDESDSASGAESVDVDEGTEPDATDATAGASDTDALGDTPSDPDAEADSTDSVDAADTAEPDAGPTVHPDCADFDYTGTFLIPGPCEAEFDADLEAKADRIERCWHALNAANMGVNTDVAIALANTADRAAVEAFCQGDSWDFEAAVGKPAAEVITLNNECAGLYAGVGLAADAFRYGVLRDQGYPAEEVERARQFVLEGLVGYHRAMEITGTPGVIARGYQRIDLDSFTKPTTIPLFDDEGNPLPADKDNGTYRDDVAGLWPNYIWKDSVSRDQMLGWATAAGVVYEVIGEDPAFDAEVVDKLQASALALGQELMKVRDSGFDLEIPDADGRTTFHGHLHETNVEGLYLPFDTSTGVGNAIHASLALGFISAWAYVTGDEEMTAYLHDELVESRHLPLVARESLGLLVTEETTNYSNTNMFLGGLWLASRYLAHEEGRETVQEAIERYYFLEDSPFAPAGLGQSYFDFIYAAGVAGQRPNAPLDEALPAAFTDDGGTRESAMQGLADFPEPPYWNYGVDLCPQADCSCGESRVGVEMCESADGASYEPLGCVGHNCELVATTPVPMSERPPSNYHWRSNPYRLRAAGSGESLLPAVDFRLAYWMARWTAVTQ